MAIFIYGENMILTGACLLMVIAVIAYLGSNSWKFIPKSDVNNTEIAYMAIGISCALVASSILAF
jgi:hypothetical protein